MGKYTNKAATAGHTGERDLAPARAVNVLADLCKLPESTALRGIPRRFMTARYGHCTCFRTFTE
jgi:hypothetical protein